MKRRDFLKDVTIFAAFAVAAPVAAVARLEPAIECGPVVAALRVPVVTEIKVCMDAANFQRNTVSIRAIVEGHPEAENGERWAQVTEVAAEWFDISDITLDRILDFPPFAFPLRGWDTTGIEFENLIPEPRQMTLAELRVMRELVLT